MIFKTNVKIKYNLTSITQNYYNYFKYLVDLIHNLYWTK